MKKIKFIIAIFLAIVLSINGNMIAFAVNENNYVKHKTIKTNGYSFNITEKTDNNYSIIRTYTKDIANNKSSKDLDETKALLVSLGMDEDSVDELYTDTLYTFSNSSNIWLTTTYTKIDEKNNTSTQVPESVAKAEAIKSEYELNLLKANSNIPSFSANINRATNSEVYKDSYMKVTYAVAYKGGGSYFFSVDAKWLKLPIFRGRDSIGSCAMNCTVTPNTSKGHYSYTTTIVDKFNHVTTNKNKIEITNRQNAINGNWYGSAGIFTLPKNGANSQSSVSHKNIKAHYEYSGHISNPDQANWFNTVGTYDHSTAGISPSASIGIDIGGKFSASIGLDIVALVRSRSVEFEIYYKP